MKQSIARTVSLWSAVMSVAVACHAAGAQPAAGAKPTTEGAQYHSPLWNRTPSGANESGPPTQIPNTAERLVGATVLAYPAARANAVEANLQFRRLDSLLNTTTFAVRRDFLESDDYAKAINDLKAAQDAYDDARQAAIADLQGTDEYASTMALHQRVSEQIADEGEQAESDPQRLLALAEMKLNYVLPLRAVERERIENSREVRQARERLREAAIAVEQQERSFRRTARADGDLAALRSAREDARIAMRASQVFAREMRTARTIALNYAYYTRQVDYGIAGFGPSYGNWGGNWGGSTPYPYGGYAAGGWSSIGFYGR